MNKSLLKKASCLTISTVTLTALGLTHMVPAYAQDTTKTSMSKFYGTTVDNIQEIKNDNIKKLQDNGIESITIPFDDTTTNTVELQEKINNITEHNIDIIAEFDTSNDTSHDYITNLQNIEQQKKFAQYIITILNNNPTINTVEILNNDNNTCNNNGKCYADFIKNISNIIKKSKPTTKIIGGNNSSSNTTDFFKDFVTHNGLDSIDYWSINTNNTITQQQLQDLNNIQKDYYHSNQKLYKKYYINNNHHEKTDNNTTKINNMVSSYASLLKNENIISVIWNDNQHDLTNIKDNDTNKALKTIKDQLKDYHLLNTSQNNNLHIYRFINNTTKNIKYLIVNNSENKNISINMNNVIHVDDKNYHHGFITDMKNHSEEKSFVNNDDKNIVIHDYPVFIDVDDKDSTKKNDNTSKNDDKKPIIDQDKKKTDNKKKSDDKKNNVAKNDKKNNTVIKHHDNNVSKDFSDNTVSGHHHIQNDVKANTVWFLQDSTVTKYLGNIHDAVKAYDDVEIHGKTSSDDGSDDSVVDSLQNIGNKSFRLSNVDMNKNLGSKGKSSVIDSNSLGKKIDVSSDDDSMGKSGKNSSLSVDDDGDSSNVHESFNQDSNDNADKIVHDTSVVGMNRGTVIALSLCGVVLMGGVALLLISRRSKK